MSIPTNLSHEVYIMGRTVEETQRLITQSGIYDASTRRLFEAAGITAGMTVLDVGSGAGDVALLATDLVGPRGRVIGFDLNPEILDTARYRAQDAGLTNVTFIDADCRDVTLPADVASVDAIVGRFILFHIADPEAALRSLLRHLRPGGIVAFQELELAAVEGLVALHPSLLVRQAWQFVLETFHQAGNNTSIGTALPALYRAVGLSEPALALDIPLGAAPDWPGYAYAVDTIRTLTRLIEQHGGAAPAYLTTDDLMAQLRNEIIRTGFPLPLGPMVSAWARKP